ncbi:MAG: hypothetical protein K0R44_1479 [Thermomicrobiales bacterium]|jgi:hypothetical protein|nr:hypothetical protein [Thermomicrobiales bacterium]
MKKFISGLAIAAIASSVFLGAASAQSNGRADSGNGGVSTSNSNGGGVSIGDTETGGVAGGTVDISGVTPGEDLAATLITQILASMP